MFFTISKKKKIKLLKILIILIFNNEFSDRALCAKKKSQSNLMKITQEICYIRSVIVIENYLCVFK